MHCPITVHKDRAGAASVSWAFNAILTSSYLHGRGSFSGGRATGSICQQDSARSRATVHLVLSVHGSGGSLARGITVGGTLGAQLVLPVTVSGSEDPACRVGTHGRVTLFSSYNGVHADTVSIHFNGSCATHQHFYRGSQVHVALPS